MGEKEDASRRDQERFPLRPLAYKHKKITGIVTEGSGVVRSESVHAVQKARKTSHPGKLRYLKPYKQNQLVRGTHEIEAASADIYRYLLGPHRAPKSRAVVGHAALSGVLSTEVTGGFTAFSDFFKKNLGNDVSHISASDLSSRGFGSLLAANYLMQENDCHWGNFGFNGEGKLSRIDFDQSMAPVTFPSQSAADFSIADSAHDLLHLTHPEDFKPYNSPLYLGQGETTEFDFRNTPLGKDLAVIEDNDPSFQMDKWKTIVKAGLLSLDMIKKIFSAHLSEQADIDLYASLLYDRFQTIKNTMMKLPEFEAFFSRHGAEMIAEVEREVDEYNQEFNKKYSERKVVVVPRELEEHYQEHFDQNETLEIIEKLKKLSDDMGERNSILDVLVKERLALQAQGKALLLECSNLIQSVTDKGMLEKINVAFSKVMAGLRNCESIVSAESGDVSRLKRSLKTKEDELNIALQKQESRIVDSSIKLAISDQSISPRRQACDEVMKILERTGSFPLRTLVDQYPVIGRFVKNEQMKPLQIMTSTKEDFRKTVSTLIKELDLKKQQTHDQHAQLEIQKKEMLEKRKAVSMRIRELDNKNVSLLKQEQEGLSNISNGFATLQREVGRKINSSVSSKKGVDPLLSKRVEELIARLDRYIEKSISVFQDKIARGEKTSPERLAVNEERVRLASHLKGLLIHDAPTSEAGFNKRIDVFIEAAGSGKLQSLLKGARTPTSTPVASPTSTPAVSPTPTTPKPPSR